MIKDKRFSDRKIKMLQCEMNYLWSGIFITGGGSITLFLTNLNVITLIIGVAGV